MHFASLLKQLQPPFAIPILTMEQFTELIDVPRLLFNSMWVLGLSIVVAAASLRQFEAHYEGITFRQALQTPKFQFWLWLGLTLATIGFAGNADLLWEQLVWFTLSILNLVQIFFAYREWVSG